MSTLNRHPYSGWTTDNPQPRQCVGEPSGWAYSDAVRLHLCPRCGSSAGFHCQTDKGRKAWPPHSDRIEKLTTEEVERCRLK